MAAELHRWFAILSAALIGLVALETLWRLRRPDEPAAGGSRLQTVMLIAVAITAAGGLGLLAGGGHPEELLHLVYGALALVTLPVALSMSRGWRPSRQRAAMVVGTLVEVGVVIRLFGTG